MLNLWFQRRNLSKFGFSRSKFGYLDQICGFFNEENCQNNQFLGQIFGRKVQIRENIHFLRSKCHVVITRLITVDAA